MNPRDLVERLVHAKQYAGSAQELRDYSDELHTAAALLKTSHVDTGARVLDYLLAEIAQARNADLEDRAQRRKHA